AGPDAGGSPRGRRTECRAGPRRRAGRPRPARRHRSGRARTAEAARRLAAREGPRVRRLDDATRWVGATPRADLLPRELLQRAAVRATRRIVVLLILLAVVLVGAGYVATTLLRAESR